MNATQPKSRLVNLNDAGRKINDAMLAAQDAMALLELGDYCAALALSQALSALHNANAQIEITLEAELVPTN